MSHHVNVVVSVEPNGQIVCTPELAVVTQPNTLLSFTLVTPGYAFPAKAAIVVTNPDSDFPFPSWTLQSAVAVLVDLNQTPGDFAYTVSLVDIESGKTLSVDPGIRNDK